MKQLFNLKRMVFGLMTFVMMNQTSLFAQTPSNGIFFQAVARDQFANPAKDRKIYVQSSIIQTTATGTKVLIEEHQTTTDGSGVFSISVGQGTRTGGTVANLDKVEWAKGPYYLNLKIAITPIAPIANWDHTKDWIDLGSSPFGTVPYALYSGSSGALDDKLSIADTAKMLAIYAKAQIVNNLSTQVNSKLSATDTATMLAPYAKMVSALVASNITSLTAASVNEALDSKVNVADSGLVYVTPLQLKGVTFDTTSLITKIDKKVNLSDSTTVFVTPLQLAAKTFDSTSIYTQLGTKLNKADTATLSNRINLKANAVDVTTSLGLKLNSTDTAVLLRKTDTATLSNRINLKANTADVTASLGLKLNSTDTTVLLRKADTATLSNRINLKANTADVTTALGLKLDAAQKGSANGVASLDNNSKVPASQIPVVSFQSANVVASQAAMLALSQAVVGSIAIRTDSNRNYVLSGSDPSIRANWVELAVPTSVTTINGIPGAFVTLTTDEIGEGTTNKYYTDTRARAALSATGPLNYNTASGTLSMTAASGSTNGYLSSTDFNTFNNKQNALTAGVDYATPSGTITGNAANVTGIVSIVNGGTGTTTAVGALTTLGAEPTINKSTATDLGNVNPSDVLFPSQKAVKTYVDLQSANAGVADLSITNAKLAGSITADKLNGSIPASKLIGTDINTVGTITSGIWSATTIALNKGGTGATTAAAARTNLGLVIGTDVMAANAVTTLTGDVTGSGNGSFATTVNSVGGITAATIAGLPTSVNANTASITAETTRATNAETALDTRVTSNTASITAETTRATNAETALDTRVTSNTASITTNTSDILLRAPLASPSFTGTPTAPTPATNDNSMTLATTAYVKASITAANAGISTIGDVSGTSSAKGATISGTTELILTPADANFAGIVTTATQTFAGAKTFTNTVTFGQNITINGMNVGRPFNPTSSPSQNTAFGVGVLGKYAPTFWTHDMNTGFGYYALYNLTRGGSNTALGNAALYNLTTGSYNAGYGSDVFPTLTTGSNNTGSGGGAGRNLSTGSDNTMIGLYAGNGITTGSNNIFLGSNNTTNINIGTGITTGSNNTIIGSGIRNLSSTLSNNIVLADGQGNIRAQHDGTNGWALGTITSGVWSGTAIANNKLANSTTTLGSTTMTLGGTVTSVTGLTSLAATNLTGDLTGNVTGNVTGNLTGNLTGNASTATALATGRTISTTGDITYTSGSFDGTADVTGVATLAASGVASGTYGSSTAIPTFSVDSKGRLTAASTVGITAGVSSLNYTTTTSYVAGGTISGTSLTLTAADATNPGLISTGAQTIAGAKTFSNDLTAPNFIGNVTGTVTGNLSGTATTATNLAGGVSGSIPYQTAAGTTAMIPVGSANQFLTSTGSGTYTWTSTSAVTGNNVPYTGASGAVNLGAYDLTVNGLTVGKGGGASANNTALGVQSLLANTSGNSNTSMGNSALKANTLGSWNTAIGSNSLAANIGGHNNTALGMGSLDKLTSGSDNIALGSSAGRNFTGGGTSTLTTSNQSIFIGSDSRAKNNSSTNEIVIGHNTTGNGNNTVTIGNSSTTANYFTGSINLTGTIDGGTWSGTTIGSNYGGAGTVNGLLKANGTGVVSAAISGTDYQAPLTAGSGISIASGTISATGLTTSNLSSTAGITNAQLANSSTTLGSTTMALGGTVTSVTGLTSLAATNLSGALTGNASTATALATGRTIALTGDVTYTSPVFDGSGDITAAATLAASGVTSGTYGSSSTIPVLTVDAKGRVTTASTVSITAGVSTVTAIAGTSNANGATISGTAFTLTPADATNGGVITTGTQTFAGSKTFNNNLTVNGYRIGKGGNNINTTIAFGDNALSNNSLSGVDNIAIGSNSLTNASSGTKNIAIGSSSLNALTTGNSNVSIGNNALSSITTNGESVAIGDQALSAATGVANTAVGSGAGVRVSSGASNVLIGAAAAINLTTGTGNVAIGPSAGSGTGTGGVNNVTGANSVFIGRSAQPQNDGQTNQVVLAGFDGSTANSGLGSNTTLIGNSATTLTQLMGALNLPNTTTSTSTTTGALRVGGGAGIVENLNVGGATTLVGAATLSNTTASSSTSTGALVVRGGAGIAGNVYIGGTLSIAGGTPAAGDVLTSDANGLASWTALSAVTSLGTFTTTSYANGGTISGSTLTLSAADANNPGLVTTGTQTFVGSKTFSNTTTFTSDIVVEGINIGRGPNSNVSTNTAIGANALNSSSVLSDNVAVGYRSLYIGTNASGYNTAVGSMSGYGHSTGDYNSFFGYNAGFNSSTGFRNTIIGAKAVGYGTITGSSNQALGYSSLYNLTSGYNNTAIGDSALYSTTSGYNNVGIGHKVLKDNTTGDYNIALGLYALNSNTSGNQNIGIGGGALYTNNTGLNNIGIGYEALNFNGSYSNNIAIGKGAGKYYSSYNQAARNLADNIFIGVDAWPLSGSDVNSIVIGNNVSTDAGAVGWGSYSTSIGNTLTLKSRIYGALTVVPNTATATGNSSTIAAQNGGTNYAGGALNLTAGNGNGTGNGGDINLTPGTTGTGTAGKVYVNGGDMIVNGNNLGAGKFTGVGNILFGSGALNANTNGRYNIAIGQSALSGFNPASATNTYNIALGYSALSGATNTGTNNIAIGSSTMGAASLSGQSNIAIGSSSMAGLTSGNNNNAVGQQSMSSGAITGIENNAFGMLALNSITGGTNNSAFGSRALYGITSGHNNVGIGAYALYTNTVARSNTSIGNLSLRYINGTADDGVGAFNIALGYQAGTYVGASGSSNNNTTGRGSLFLGYDTRPLADGDVNEVVISGFAGVAGNAGMVGNGSNTVTIGNTSNTANYLRGVTNLAAGTMTNTTGVDLTGSINDFFQFNVKNSSTGSQAQSGYAATADNGTNTSGFAWMGINNSTFNYPTAYNIGAANDVTYVGSGQDMHIANANNTKSIIFSTGTATTPYFSEKMRITATGNVGIGTNSPTANLEVTGTTKLVGAATFSSTVSIPTGAAAGKVLTSDASGGATWQNSGGSVVTMSATGTATSTATYIIFTGSTASQTITIPSAVTLGAGRELTIKNVASVSVSIASAGGYLIQDNSTLTSASAALGIEPSNNWMKLVSDGTNWYIFRALF